MPPPRRAAPGTKIQLIPSFRRTVATRLKSTGLPIISWIVKLNGNMKRNAPVSAIVGKTLKKIAVRREPLARDETYAPRAPKKGSAASHGGYRRTVFDPLLTM